MRPEPPARDHAAPRPAGSPIPPEGLEALFLATLPLTEATIRSVCLRHHVSTDDTEEFAATVRLKLIESDYAVLRKFQGRSTFETYLTTVIQRLFLDYRNRAWGKWRPSTAAKRIGPTAIRFEQLLRDGFGVDEACRALRENDRVAASPAQLADLAARLPRRTSRRFEDDSVLYTFADRQPLAEDRLLARERLHARRQALAALERALSKLPAEDHALLEMRFTDGRPIVEIARALGLDPRRCYRRLAKIVKGLRHWLEREGVRRELAMDSLRVGT